MKYTFKRFGVIATVAVVALGMAACASVSIVSVEWDTLKGPAKVRQYLSVSTTEVSVYANYKDESRKEVTFFSTSHDRDKIGMQTVTVTISGQGSGTFQTEVMEMTGIRVDKPPTKTTYTVGEKADLAGIRVMGSWIDFPEAEIPAYQITATRFDSGSVGNKVVTVDYKGKTATFPITVTAAAAAAPPPAASAAPAAPAASQPSQPAQQQPSTQQPSQQGQLDQRVVGTWSSIGNNISFTYTFNANGTGTSRTVGNDFTHSDTFTWSTNGNKLTMGNITFRYSISGNTLTLSGDFDGATQQAFTRQ